MAGKAFTEHPEFKGASSVANAAVHNAAGAMGLLEAGFDGCDEHTARVVDDLTELLLRAYDAKAKKAGA